MPIEANARITLRGGPESLKVLQGVRRGTSEAAKEARKAAQESERAAKATARAAEAASRAQQKAARDAAKASEKASRDSTRAAEQSQKAIERAAQKEADRWQQMARQSARVREAAQQAATRSAQREAAKQIEIAKKTAAAEAKARQDAVRGAGGMVGAATAGVLAGGMSAASTARGIAGSQDVGQRIQAANQFRERLVLATNQAGMGADERQAVEGQVLAASTSTGKDIGELMSVLETGQAQFNNLKFFADNLKEIATISKAAGADTGEFATALGFVQQAFGLSGDEAMEAAYLMKASADKGSVELKDFAAHFADAAGIFAMSTGQKGMGGVRQYLGAAQGVATGGFGAAESATRMKQAASFLNRAETQKDLKAIGIKNIVGPGGKIDLGSVLEKLGSNKKFMGSAQTRQEIFSDVQAREGIEAMLAARSRVQAGATGAVDFKTISEVDAASGRAATGQTFEAMQGEGFFKMQQEAAQMQADTVTNLSAYNAQVLGVTEASNRLEKAFGTLSVWAGSIATMGLVGAGTSMLGKLASGGGAAAGGGALARAVPSLATAGGAISGAGASALAAGSSSVALGSAAGLAAAGGVALVGGAVGGAVGYGIDKGVEAVTGEKLSEKLGNAIFELVHGNNELVRVTKETNRKLDSIDQGQRANVVKPAAPGAREPR